MSYGVVCQTLAAFRKEPFEHSEMVSQVLFGETFAIIEEFNDWLRVSLTLDSYEGWIDKKVCIIIDQEQMDLLSLHNASSVATRLFTAKPNNSELPIRLCPGSTLYNFNAENGTFKLIGKEYKTFNLPFDGTSEDKIENLILYAKEFINAPYLWGGRSPYGIDCSGLVQVVFKMIGISVPRDASQQIFLGTTIEFINLAQPGDLAFFDDEEGNITHVGIILPNNLIIHSSGFVHVDIIDHQGIYSNNSKVYSHKLRMIKRVIPS
jgi:cell wall-associated NlpC family hydrolase